MKKIFFSIIFVFLISKTLLAMNYNYQLSWAYPNSKIFIIQLETQASDGAYTDFQIPAWRPGRYIMQDFAGGLSGFNAKDEDQKELSWKKIDKDTWRVTNPKNGKITISYQMYANKMDAGSSYLSRNQAFLNPVNLLMHVKNQYNIPCKLIVPKLPENWKVASPIWHSESEGVHTFKTQTYHELVDAPMIFSPNLTQFDFKLDDKTIYFHFNGNFLGDSEVQDYIKSEVGKIIREQTAVFDTLPVKNYHFLVQLVPYYFRHAVEHSNSSVYVLPEGVSATKSSVKSGMLGIVSHEFWHTWNVKRIRPATMVPYDYQIPPYTHLHWFTEGVTDYYELLARVRSGVISKEDFWADIESLITNLESQTSSKEVSPASASFNSWLATSTYGAPYLQASYYPLGKRIALLLDLKILSETNGEKCLDDLFKYLYDEVYLKDLGVPENGIEVALGKITGKDFGDFFEKYIYGTEKLPYKSLLNEVGMDISTKKSTLATYQRVGIDGIELVQNYWMLKGVKLGSDAFKSGLSAGDVIMEVDGQSVVDMTISKFFSGMKQNQTYEFLVFSDSEKIKVKLKFTGNDLPLQYHISKMDNSKPEKVKMLNNWLKSRQ